MRYERTVDVLKLAMRFQGSSTGVTLDDIRDELGVSRRTAERMRDAVEWAFGPLELVDIGDNKNHWRLRSNALLHLVRFDAEELAELSRAAEMAERAGHQLRADALREIEIKLRATLRDELRTQVEASIEALTQVEGLAMRAGPRVRFDQKLLGLLREAITTCRVIECSYLAQSSGRWSQQQIEPYGLLFGNRTFLAGRTGRDDKVRYWRLANMNDVRIGDSFIRDPEFNLTKHARRSFGTFQEEPIDVTLRFSSAAARDASSFLFHPNQNVEKNADGTLTVCFTAGGRQEICWHLFTWGETVTIEKPAHLREQLAAMCRNLAQHHEEAR